MCGPGLPVQNCLQARCPFQQWWQSGAWVNTTSALSADWPCRSALHQRCRSGGGVLTLTDQRRGHFLKKLALTRTPDPIQPTRWGPDPNQPMRRVMFLWKLADRDPVVQPNVPMCLPMPDRVFLCQWWRLVIVMKVRALWEALNKCCDIAAVVNILCALKKHQDVVIQAVILWWIVHTIAVHCFQMDAYNLAIMFGPALVRPHDDDMTTMLKDMSVQCQIVESFIRHVSDNYHLMMTHLLS